MCWLVTTTHFRMDLFVTSQPAPTVHWLNQFKNVNLRRPLRIFWYIMTSFQWLWSSLVSCASPSTEGMQEGREERTGGPDVAGPIDGSQETHLQEEVPYPRKRYFLTNTFSTFICSFR